MSATQDEEIERLWRLANVRADTMLKTVQTKTEVWKVVVTAVSAAAGLLAAGAAIGGLAVAYLLHH